MTTLPVLTRTIDDSFVNTWYEIRAKVIDNILSSTPLMLALRKYGCFRTQIGGQFITRTVGYGTKSTQRIRKGSTLTQSEPKLDTLARWDWRYLAVDVNRSMVDDQKNAGKFKIKDYVQRRVMAARDGLVSDFETYLLQWGNYYAAPEQPNSIYDICAPYTSKSTAGDGSNSDKYDADVSAGTGTNSSGYISRSNNTWWRNQVKRGTYYEVNLVQDMRNFFNTIQAANRLNEAPNLIVCSQDNYEVYEDEIGDKQQIVRTAFNRTAADLGFASQTFKGAAMIWSNRMPTMSANTLTEQLFLNTNYLEFIYDPQVWFEMTPWKDTSNQLERVAYILCACAGCISAQLRVHGNLSYVN